MDSLTVMDAIELGGLLAVILGGWWWVKMALRTLAAELRAEREEASQRFEKLIGRIETLESSNARTLDLVMSSIRKVLDALVEERAKHADEHKTIELALKDILGEFRVIAAQLKK